MRFAFEVSPASLGVVKIVKFNENFFKFSFVLLSNFLMLKTTDIPTNMTACSNSTVLEPYAQGSHEKAVVGTS